MSIIENLIPVVRKIAIDNDPILKIPGIDVEDVMSPDIQQLIVDMLATMKFANGIGLAAPQISVSLRIMVFYLPAARDDINNVGVPETVLINPIIKPLNDETVVDFEGCLSVPGFRGQVKRFKRISYTGFNQFGEFIERIAEGWHARLVQHEFDHLNGVLYPELMAHEDKLLTLEEWKILTSH